MKKKPKRHSKLKIILFLILLITGLCLGLYCFYGSAPCTPRTLYGPKYPIKVAGNIAPKKTFHVYQKFVDSSNNNTAECLLPSQEVPELPCVAVETPSSKDVEKNISQSIDSILKHQNIDQTKPHEALSKTCKNETEPKILQQKPKTFVSTNIQIGPVYATLSQAQQGFISLKKLQPWPPNVIAHFQKGKSNNKMFYRLILSFPSSEAALSYQQNLKKKKTR